MSFGTILLEIFLGLPQLSKTMSVFMPFQIFLSFIALAVLESYLARRVAIRVDAVVVLTLVG